ncbi:hypothetical protein FHS83_000065 [Rhizomicrobium palustre]|uniref:DUF2188 domain-containing protein n=1 Tax=Rhizomicrobium palustre TaxID=189966 RepID=A0A846MUR0_9PROT|nr:hypothetical protein [Rhizomicrobium palustre]NIK86747.1 hypothetical protein [Rhizomicrobium palustre]
MRQKSGYVVLADHGGGYWEVVGPVAPEHPTLKEAETAARELSARYPKRVFGVYELRAIFAIQEKVVKHRVEMPVPRRKSDARPAFDDVDDRDGGKIVPIRAAENG